MISFPFTANPVINEAGVITGFDRATNTVDNRKFNGLLYTDGVDIRYENGFKVVADSGLTIKVMGSASSTEIAWAKVGNTYAYEPDAYKSFTLDAADVILKRIDRVILRKDDTTAVRKVDIIILKGTPASTPVSPAITRNETIYDLVLADIYIGANATEITTDNITDQRLNEDVCGVFKSTFAIEELINLKYIEHTTAPITYYVSPTGSNTNNGLSVVTPFATVAYALSKLPKYINHTVTINFATGTYTEPRIICKGFLGDGEIILFARNSGSDDYFLQHGIAFARNTCKISCSGLSASSIESTGSGFAVDANPGYVYFQYCQSNNLSGSAQDGFTSVASANVRCDNCWARDHHAGFVTDKGGIMSIYNCDVSTSATGLHCTSGLLIKYGGTISTTVANEVLAHGGIITRNSGAVLGTN